MASKELNKDFSQWQVMGQIFFNDSSLMSPKAEMVFIALTTETHSVDLVCGVWNHSILFKNQQKWNEML